MTITIDTKIALIEKSLKDNTRLTKEIHTAITGTNGKKGIITRLNLVEASNKRVWYFLGVLVSLVGGILMKLMVF